MNKHPKIFSRGFLMIGFPNENLSQIHDTISVAQTMALDWYTVQLLTPLPNTEIYDQMVEAGKAKKDELNLDGEGFTMFSVRESDKQRMIEEKKISYMTHTAIIWNRKTKMNISRKLRNNFKILMYMFQKFKRSNEIIYIYICFN